MLTPELKELLKDKEPIFGVGLSKTGTSSLDKYFKNCNWPTLRVPLEVDSIYNFVLDNDKCYIGELGTAVMVRFGSVLEILPKAKLILTYRAVDDWWLSFKNHFIDTNPCAAVELGLIFSIVFNSRLPNETEAKNGFRKHLHWFIEQSRTVDGLLLDVSQNDKKNVLRRFTGAECNDPYPHENIGEYNDKIT